MKNVALTQRCLENCFFIKNLENVAENTISNVEKNTIFGMFFLEETILYSPHLPSSLILIVAAYDIALCQMLGNYPVS